MKRRWAGSLVLGLGLWGGVAAAEDFSWQPAASGPQPAVPAAVVARPLGATLGRPVPVPQPSIPQAGAVAPVGYWVPEPAASAPVFRGQKPDDATATPPADPPPARAKKDAAKPAADRAQGNRPPGMPALLPAPNAAGKGPAKLARPQPARRVVAANSAAGPATRQVTLTAHLDVAPGSPAPEQLPAPAPVEPGAPLPSSGAPLPPAEVALPGGGVIGDGGPGDCLPACEDPFCCDGDVCACQAAPAPLNRFYGSAEYLLWTVKDGHAPVLATTGPNDAHRAALALPGEPGTTVLFGGPLALDYEEQSGGRFTAGYWLDACQQNGIEGSFFFLGRRDLHFQANSNEFPVLVRPFTNAATGMETFQATTKPGQATGSLTIDSPTQLWGAEADWRHSLCCGCWYRLDLLAGFRYVDLDEGLHITERDTAAPGVGLIFPQEPAGTQNLVLDRFDTHNQFYGGQVGLNGEVRYGKWSLEGTVKVALGDMHEVVNISGGTAVLRPGRPAETFPGGLLALDSNSGHHDRNRFAVVPEAGVTLGYQVTDKVRLFAGYNFLFLSDVVRPGDQIDTTLETRRIPSFVLLGAGGHAPPTVPPRPLFQFRDSTFWAQGLTTGVELKY